MVVEYVRYDIPPEQHDQFKSAYTRAAEVLAGSEHCRAWELSRGVEEPEHYVLRIEWDSLEGHEQGFRKSPGFRDFLAAIGSYVPNVREMRHYAPTAVAGR